MTIFLIFFAGIVIFAWLWNQNQTLSFYNLQLVAGLTFAYFLKNFLFSKKIAKTQNSHPKTSKFLDALILSTIIVFLVLGSGTLESPFFFLFYFLLFGLSFLINPETSFGFSVILVIFFCFQLFIFQPEKINSDSILKIVSLIFIAPLALFFGQEHLKNLTNEQRIFFFKKKWLKNEGVLEKLEKEAIFWLSLNFRKTIAEILEITATMLAEISKLSPFQKTQLKKMRRKLKKLLMQGKKLAVKIDQETDEK